MKKIIRLLWLAIVFMAAMPAANSQTQIFFEDFQGGVMPAGFTLFDVDGLTPATQVSFVNDAWIVGQYSAGEFAAVSTSWYNPAGQADDWMWTSAISLTTGNELNWWATVTDPNFSDGYEVYVAPFPTSNPGLAVKVFEVAEENANWTFHSVNLTALGLTNGDYYIGFRNNSIDKSLLLIDDIEVTEDLQPIQFDAAMLGAYQPSEYSIIPFSQNRPVDVACAVLNNGASALTNLNVTANVWTDTLVASFTGSAVASLSPFGVHDFIFPAFTATASDFYVFEFIVSSNETDEVTSNDTTYSAVWVHDSLYARDDAALVGQLGIGTGLGGYLGQSYEVLNPVKLAAVELFHVASDAGEPLAAVVWSTDANGVPDQIVASTDTLVWGDDAGGYVSLPISGGDKVLAPGNYVVAAVEFDSVLQLGTTGGIFTFGTTWVWWPTIPGGQWVNNEIIGQQFEVTYVIRPVLANLCQPIPIVTSVIDAACYDENGTAIAAVGGIVPPQGTFTFQWSNGETMPVISAFPGVYTVVVSDENGCTSEAVVEIGQPDELVVDVIVSDPSIPGGNGSISTTTTGGTPPYSILWSNAEVTETVSVQAGTYSFVVTDGAGCQFISGDYVVNSIAQPMSGDIVVENGLCAGDLATLTANAAGGVAPYTYLWGGGETTASISTGVSGAYSCVVTDQVGTSITFNGSVTLPMAITSTNSSTNATCQFCADGTATVNPSGGTGAFTFLWDNGATTQTNSGLSAGVHICTIWDANGCSTSQTVLVAFDIQAMTANLSVVWAGCPGNPATLTVSVSGGVQPYTYLWSNGATSASTTVFNSGAYTCTVTDFVGTTVVLTNTFNQPAALASTTTTTPATCSNCPTGSATVAATGGTAPYSYLWNNGSTTATINNVPPGNYSVVITDANGCTMTNSAIVEFVIGTDEADVVRALDIFPNPTTDFFFVNGQLVENEPVTLKLTTADGKIIFEKMLDDRREFSQQIDLTDQPAGLFLLTIQTASGTVSRPVVKQ